MINNKNRKAGRNVVGLVGQGFSLVELMLVVAVIGILAGIVTVSLSGQRNRANDTKILAELSATIQPMLTCWSDGESVWFPSHNGSADICIGGNPEYGQWPVMDSNYLYADGLLSGNTYTGADDVDWSFWIEGSTGRICCNRKYKQCVKIPTADNCDADTDLTTY